MNKKLEQMSLAKRRAYDHVIELATELLKLQTPFAFKCIRRAFEEYKRLEKQEDRYVWRYAHIRYSYMYALANNKTVVDIWWRLPESTRALWDADPQLKAWRERHL